MAYFSKEIYERKANYAYTISMEGIRAIAQYFVKKDGYSEDDEEYEDMIDNYAEIFEPVARLSHLRHEIHSNTQYRLLEFWDSSFDRLIDEVNELNRKYDLAPVAVETMECDSFVDLIMENEIVLESLGIEKEQWDKYLDENGDWKDDNEIGDMIDRKMDENIDKWSESIRNWFGYINEKFGSDFPH